MTWVIKILETNFTKTDKEWNGFNWVDTDQGLADFMINDFQFSNSTWREVSYERREEVDIIRRLSTSADVVLTTNSKRYQFIEPLVSEINLVLPQVPQFNVRYLIKNLSEINNKINVRGSVGGDILFTLDSVNEVAILFHDGIEFQIKI